MSKYAPLSEVLWNAMVQALDALPMPGPSNRQLLQTLQQVQQQAQMDEVRSKAPTEAP